MMNTRINERIVSAVLLAILLMVTACGTLEVGVEPESSLVDALDPATQTRMLVETSTPDRPAADPTGEVTPESTAGPTEPAVVEESQDEPATTAVTPSEISTLDETWSKYTNHQMGFSINFPRTMIHSFGSCSWNEEEESYRPEVAFVPVEIFEEDNTVYISSQYYHELTGEIKRTDAEGGTRSFFSDCSAIENSLLRLGDPANNYQLKWEIVAAEVHDDQEVDGFIKSRYGAGCSLGEMMTSGQDGVYDITIQGDGLDLSQTLCPINYQTVVKYYPTGNKIIAWDTGQSFTFAADLSYQVTHDQEMIESFRFLTES